MEPCDEDEADGVGEEVGEVEAVAVDMKMEVKKKTPRREAPWGSKPRSVGDAGQGEAGDRAKA